MSRVFSFVLCHGSNNRFMLVDETFSGRFNDGECSALALAVRKLTDLKLDGVLFCVPVEKSGVAMRIYNTDGTRAKMCGNGLRCVGRYAMEKEKVQEVYIKNCDDLLSVSLREDFASALQGYVAEVGPACFGGAPMQLPGWGEGRDIKGAELPLLERYLGEGRRYFTLTMPNPHLIAFGGRVVEGRPLRAAWDYLNTVGAFADGVNLSALTPLEGGKAAVVQTCERGVGLTSACGSAFGASRKVMTQTMGIVGEVRMFSKGGFVLCDEGGDTENVLVVGDATFEASGVLSFDPQEVTADILEFELNEGEVENYKRFVKERSCLLAGLGVEL